MVNETKYSLAYLFSIVDGNIYGLINNMVIIQCHKYRLKFDQTSRNRMREKVTASILFRGRKDSYPRTVSHPFLGDYVRLRNNKKFKQISTKSGDYHIVFADIVNKINRSSGEVS